MNRADILSTSRWAISKDGLRSIIMAAQDTPVASREEYDPSTHNNIKCTMVEVQAQSEDGSTKRAGSCCIVDVIGPLYVRSSLYTWWFGMVGMDTLGEYLQRLDADDSVDSIVIRFDTPGGTLAGTEDLGNIIRGLKKPVVGYAENGTHSAGYWLFSQCDHGIAANNTTYLGSIGVLMSHTSYEKYYDEYGIEINILTARQSTDKVVGPSHKALSDDDRQTIVDQLTADCNVFHKVVKSGRSEINMDVVGSAKIFNAKDAKKYGMIDEIAGAKGISLAVQRATELAVNGEIGSGKPSKRSEETTAPKQTETITATFEVDCDGDDVVLNTETNISKMEKYSHLNVQIMDSTVQNFSANMGKVHMVSKSSLDKLANALKGMEINLSTVVSTDADASLDNLGLDVSTPSVTSIISNGEDAVLVASEDMKKLNAYLSQFNAQANEEVTEQEATVEEQESEETTEESTESGVEGSDESATADAEGAEATEETATTQATVTESEASESTEESTEEEDEGDKEKYTDATAEETDTTEATETETDSAVASQEVVIPAAVQATLDRLEASMNALAKENKALKEARTESERKALSAQETVKNLKENIEKAKVQMTNTILVPEGTNKDQAPVLKSGMAKDARMHAALDVARQLLNERGIIEENQEMTA